MEAPHSSSVFEGHHGQVRALESSVSGRRQTSMFTDEPASIVEPLPWQCFFCKTVHAASATPFKPHAALTVLAPAPVQSAGCAMADDDDDDYADDSAQHRQNVAEFDPVVASLSRSALRFCNFTCWIARVLLKHGDQGYIAEKLRPAFGQWFPEAVGGHIAELYVAQKQAAQQYALVTIAQALEQNPLIAGYQELPQALEQTEGLMAPPELID